MKNKFNQNSTHCVFLLRLQVITTLNNSDAQSNSSSSYSDSFQFIKNEPKRYVIDCILFYYYLSQQKNRPIFILIYFARCRCCSCNCQSNKIQINNQRNMNHSPGSNNNNMITSSPVSVKNTNVSVNGIRSLSMR